MFDCLREIDKIRVEIGIIADGKVISAWRQTAEKHHDELRDEPAKRAAGGGKDQAQEREAPEIAAGADIGRNELLGEQIGGADSFLI